MGSFLDRARDLYSPMRYLGRILGDERWLPLLRGGEEEREAGELTLVRCGGQTLRAKSAVRTMTCLDKDRGAVPPISAATKLETRRRPPIDRIN